MCDCTTHHWLARPLHPQAGQQVLAGTTTTHRDAVGHALAAALDIYDHHTPLGYGGAGRVELVVDDDVLAWIGARPPHDPATDRQQYRDGLERLHGRLLGHDQYTELPTLPNPTTRIDLDTTAPTQAPADSPRSRP